MAASPEMLRLMKKKDQIEADIKALNGVLESQKGVGLKEPLVDKEGFPRSDIDVYSVRHARHDIICLQTDHQEIMKEIEEELYKIHAEARKQNNKTSELEEKIADHRVVRLPAFATVDRVDINSPAEEAGLHIGDSILKLGSVTKDNFKSLQTIGTLVQHSKDTVLPLHIKRGEEYLQLILVPRTWDGRGLLGCNIVPTH